MARRVMLFAAMSTFQTIDSDELQTVSGGGFEMMGQYLLRGLIAGGAQALSSLFNGVFQGGAEGLMAALSGGQGDQQYAQQQYTQQQYAQQQDGQQQYGQQQYGQQQYG